MNPKISVSGTLLLMMCLCLRADIIAQWDFNSIAPDNNPSTGSLAPSIGSGVAHLVGGVSALFAAGGANDPALSDNSGWNTSSYPAQGTSNKTAGVQFSVSTLGYSNILIRWDHKVSSSASKYCRLQFSPDGLSFCDYPNPVLSTVVSSRGSVFESQGISLESISSAANNPEFAFRIVTEFESTAFGTGAERYVTTFDTNSYSRNGTIRFDIVTIIGERIPNANTSPFLSHLARAATVVNTATQPILISIDDAETPAENLFLAAVSANPALVPNTPANIISGGNAGNRTLILVPAAGQTGVALITLTVSDGTNHTSSAFPLMVIPSVQMIFFDPFSYPDGPLLSNSGYLWDHRSGSYGTCAVTNGQLQITAAQTEDVIAPLLGGPYWPGSNVALYASFKATFLTLPKFNAGYFAHFSDGNVLRARIFASTSNSLPGCFRLLLSNGSDSATLLPWNLHTNTQYSLVTRYELDSARSSLWLNPSADYEPDVTAVDAQTPAGLSCYGFRQDAQVGCSILIDDLRVGLSFAEVAPQASSESLRIERGMGIVVLRWNNSNLGLQTALSATGPFISLRGVTCPYTNLISDSARFFRLDAGSLPDAPFRRAFPY